MLGFHLFSCGHYNEFVHLSFWQIAEPANVVNKEKWKDSLKFTGRQEPFLFTNSTAYSDCWTSRNARPAVKAESLRFLPDKPVFQWTEQNCVCGKPQFIITSCFLPFLFSCSSEKGERRKGTKNFLQHIELELRRTLIMLSFIFLSFAHRSISSYVQPLLSSSRQLFNSSQSPSQITGKKDSIKLNVGD